MTEIAASAAKSRTVNIDSAIYRSSYHLPLFVALSVEGGEAQVVKTFATARDVFDRVFSVMLDRLRQSRAVEKIERLVPASAHLKESASTEYVLVVRGKAIFWFSGAAAKRAAGRRLLLEHARELAIAEQAPFYVLNTRAKKVRFAVGGLGLIATVAVSVVLWQFPVHWPVADRRPAAVPVATVSTEIGDPHLASGGIAGSTSRTRPEPFASFDVTAGETLGREAFPDVPADATPPVRRLRATPPRQREVVAAASAPVPETSTATGDSAAAAELLRPTLLLPAANQIRSTRTSVVPKAAAAAAPSGTTRPN